MYNFINVKLFKEYWGIILVVALSVVPLVALAKAGLPVTHDGQDHVARIANFYQNLSEGNMVPRWAGNLNWGYGHPILMFLYPLPSYIASLFHFLGFSLVDSVKLVFAAAFIASGITMYLWLREFLGEYSAIAGAILYNFAPYRFVDLYVRGAIGEHVAFVFPPLICYFLLKISNSPPPRSERTHLGGVIANRFYFAGACFSLAGLILSHNALLLMFLPFIAFYAIYLIYNSKNRKLFGPKAHQPLAETIQHSRLAITYILIGILGFGLSFFFLYPAFAEGKYTLRDIVASTEYFSRFVRLDQLFYGPWTYGISGQFTVQVGIMQWILVLGSLFTVHSLFRKNRKMLTLYSIVLIVFIASLFLMLVESDFIWRSLTTLQKFQFPWRFLSVSVFASATLGAILLYSIKNENFQKLALAMVLIAAFVLTNDYWKAKDYLVKPELFYTGIYDSTTDTGESSPVWSVRFMEKRPAARAEVIAGEAKIDETLRTSTHHKYQIGASEKSRIRENTLYFPGWRVYIDGKRYDQVQFQDPEHRGLITYYVPQGMHIVDVEFRETRTRTVANYISLASLLLIVGIFFRTYILPKR